MQDRLRKLQKQLTIPEPSRHGGFTK
jgi:hypothetical protein